MEKPRLTEQDVALLMSLVDAGIEAEIQHICNASVPHREVTLSSDDKKFLTDVGVSWEGL